MADNAVIARPYAQAVFEIARTDGTFADWSKLLEFAAVAVGDAGSQRLLARPGADLAGFAIAIADVARDQLSGPAPLKDGNRSPGASFLRLLAENRRLQLLPDIAARYEVLKAEAEKALDVTLTSAIAVSAEQQARIVGSLTQRFSRDVRLKVNLDSQLIGGARLQVGDRVIDGSVRNGLEKLATALKVG
jgi:F-type H+-transporting ATPase subunit delta